MSLAPHNAVKACFAALLALCGLAMLLAGPASATPTCDGKKATIVSNAAKIVGTKAPDVIVAGPGDNTIYGEGGDDTICGGEGNDTIYGGRGSDYLFGEGGDDVIHGERGSDFIDGGAGTDKVYGDSGNDHVNGGPGDKDLVEGDQGDDFLEGGAGNEDILIGGPGNDHIDGGPGEHDVADYSNAAGALTINLQTQTVTGAENEHLSGIEDAIGGGGDDTLIGDPNTANRLDGGPGDDRIVAAGPGDEAIGGPGQNKCEGPFATETQCGGEEGAPGAPGGGTTGNGNGPTAEISSSLTGGGTLNITGTDGNDNMTVSYAHGDYIVTGTGSGTVELPGQVSSIMATMGPGNDSISIEPSVPASVHSILEGGPGEDTLRGGEGNDILYAGEDHVPDTLEGGGGDDVLFGVNMAHPRKDSGPATMIGGPGNDLMVGGQPCDGDTFDGGPGPNDSASFARVHNSGIYVEATIGGPVVDPDVANCNAGHIDSSTEKIEGSPGPDILIGDNGDNVLLGRGGNDKLNGMGGNDTCIGGGGENTATNCENVHSADAQSGKAHRHTAYSLDSALVAGL
jgi:Ca2+-binding RTX toxin-like protein